MMKIRQALLISLLLLGFGLSAMPVLAQTAATSSGFQPQLMLKNTLEWIENLGSVGAIAFIGIYIISTVAFLPGSMLTLSAGVLFGVWLGAIYVLIGATLGAIGAFLVGRYLARDWVAKKIDRKSVV